MQPKPTAYSFVFDLGNVLIRWNPRNLYRKIFGTDTEAMEWFLSNVCTLAWNERHDAGLPFAEGSAELISAFPQYSTEIRAYFSRWDEMLDGAIQENVDLLADLKRRGLPVYALSNWSTETFPIAQKRFPFLGLFDGIILSGNEGLIKPNPAIYRLLLSRYSLQPKETVFIDDSSANIAAAAALGIIAIHYHEPYDVRARMLELGVLT